MRRNAPWSVALAAFILAAAGTATAQIENAEKCYGVSPAGENDGMTEDATPGGATVDYQGNAWKWVEKGDCLTMTLPVQTDGTPRRGALQPLRRDVP